VGDLDTLFTFDGGNSTDDFGIVAWHWEFGDGATATTEIATHTYPSRGTFLANLTVWDEIGQADSDVMTIDVLNRPPVADAGDDQSVQKGTLVALDGGASYDADGDDLGFQWVQTSGPAVPLQGATTQTPTSTPNTAGVFVFTLTVDDGYGGTDFDAVSVVVWSLSPLANLSGSPTVAEVGDAIEFDGSLSSDPDGTIVDYAFDFGDGQLVSGPDALVVHAYATPGTYGVTLTATDEDGNTSSAQVTVAITPRNRRPTIVSSNPQAASVDLRSGEHLTFDVVAEDPDDDPLTYSWTVDGTGVQEGTTFEYRAVEGVHIVNVTVSDGVLETWREWTVTVEAPPLALPWWLIILPILAGVIFTIVGLVLVRRRRGKEGTSRRMSGAVRNVEGERRADSEEE
jgi:PKD repeat protein